MTEGEMRGKKGDHPLGDAGQLILLALFLVLWVSDSFFFRKSTFLSDAVPISIRLVILCLALIVAACLYKSGHVVVSPKRLSTDLISTGAFRYVRHPLYLGNLMVYVGLTVSTVSLFCLALLAVIAIFYDYIATCEEKLLEIRLAEAYKAYKRRTGKWVPRI